MHKKNQIQIKKKKKQVSFLARQYPHVLLTLLLEKGEMTSFS